MRPIRREITPAEREAAPPAPGALRNGRRAAPPLAAASNTRALLSEAARRLAEQGPTPPPAPRRIRAAAPPVEQDERPGDSSDAAQQRRPGVDLRHQSPQREALARMPEALARELVAIPVREVPGGIEVAVVEIPEPS